MDANRFGPSFPGSLVPNSRYTAPDLAFVPHPIPRIGGIYHSNLVPLLVDARCKP